MENTFYPITLSNRFKDILYRMNDNISKFIINLDGNNDYNYPFSFIDITDDENLISFLQNNRHKTLHLDRGNADLVWSSSYRNNLKAGRLVNRIAPFYNSAEIENWSNSFKAEYKNSQKNIKFKIIEGEDIIKYYNGKYYAYGNGSLNKSCMRHDICAEYMTIYSKNPDKIKMLILMDGKNDIIIGRSLLWKLDMPSDTWFLDRIYVKDESDTILFKKHAEKNGWLYKKAQTFDSPNVIANGKDVYVDMKVYISGDYKFFPYLDTLFYFNVKEKYLTNIDDEYLKVPCVIKLREINGNSSGNEHYIYDKLNDEYINACDAIYCFYGDYYTHKNYAYYSKQYDEYISPDILRYSRYYNHFISSVNSVYSYVLGTFILIDDVNLVYLSADKKSFDYFLKIDIEKSYVKLNSEYFILDIIVKGNDKKYYLKEDYNKKRIKKLKSISTLKSKNEILKHFIIND